MSSYFIIVIVLRFIVDEQLNVSAFLTIPSNSNHNSSDFLRSTDFHSFLNLQKQSKRSNFFDLASKSNKHELNSTIHELCGMNTGQFCEYYGYRSENFTVTTTDGYILTIFRCHGRRITQRQPVLLVHGLLDSSDTWAMNPGTKSLAFNYIERGYDVYMLNCRGNRYSQQHSTLRPSQKAFWNFSWREMARHDLPETINAIRQRTDSATIQCIGHSQGGTILLALLATAPQYNRIVSHVGLFAPFLLKSRVGFPMNVIYKLFYYFDYNNYLPVFQHNLVQDMFSETICKAFDGKLCHLLMHFLLGPSFDQLDDDMIPVYADHFPAGSSSKQLWHFGQEIHCNYFGELVEMPPPICPTHQSPSFDLALITAPLTIFYSPTDPHTSQTDMETLHSRLSQANVEMINIRQYNHFDFIWGKNAAKDTYDRLIARAEEFANKNHQLHHHDDNF